MRSAAQDPISRALQREDPDDRMDPQFRQVLSVRAGRWLPQIRRALGAVYPDDPRVLDQALQTVVRRAAERPDALRHRDHLREADPDWFKSESMVGYVTYVDRFAGTLEGIAPRLAHLRDLGITYLHLMPLLKAREQPNDGGYAVVDFTEVDPHLGTMKDLAELADTLHERDMNLCIDMVINHTAAEHDWARLAVEGDQAHAAYYRTFPDRRIPDAFEATLPEVFPDTAPGNFTFDEGMGRWVWTTFNPWQWDLNWANPKVFIEILSAMLHLANQGVDVIRLDAIPFIWKTLGTNCQNLPQVHLLLQALRGLVAIAAPALILKGEAIVAPADLVPYQGVATDDSGRVDVECDLLYHNQLMVQGWSSLAAQDGRLATLALSAMPLTPSHASWVTYVRGHDDIGWAIDDAAAAGRGWGGATHRRFLSAFFAGELPYSYAEGDHFQEDFVSGDRRTSGTTASMVGIPLARRAGDLAALKTGIDRLLLLYALAASYGGIPLIYMGDELALGNDTSFLARPDHAADNRWMHRPQMDWDTAARREDPGTVEGEVYRRLAHLMGVRKTLPTLRAGGMTTPIHHDNDHVLAFMRAHPRTGRMVGLANFSPAPQSVDATAVGVVSLHGAVDALAPTDQLTLTNSRLRVPPLGMRWITE